MPKLMIVDGNSLANRAFYALPLLATAKGVYTNAAYGFAMMLNKVIEEYQPDYLTVAFDLPEPTFRHLEYKDYKGQRQKGPVEMGAQFPLIKEILAAYRIPVLELPGFEADDILGTVAHRAQEAGIHSYLVTGDRDAFQLISPYVTALYTQRKGITDLEEVNEDSVRQRFGVDPQQLIDLKGLMGDTSDNIPGVPSVGEKTAAKLIVQFGSMDNLYDHLDEVKGNKLKESLTTYHDQAFLSRRLATIRLDAPLDVPLDGFKRQEPDWEQVRRLFRELEFTTLLERIAPAECQQSNDYSIRTEYRLCQSWSELVGHIGDAAEGTQIYVSAHTQGDRFQPDQGSLALAGESGDIVYVESLSVEDFAAIKKWLGNHHLVGHDLKALGTSFDLWPLGGIVSADDLMVAAYLLDPGQGVDITSLARRYLGLTGNLDTGDVPQAVIEVQLLRDLALPILNELQDKELESLYRDVELPLVPILALMERNGVRVERQRLEAMAQEMQAKVEQLTADIYQLAGEEFNLNSTKQLGTILFEKLGLPVVKKTKTGYSTDVEVLEKLAMQHEIVAKLLEYRTVAKLKSTYVEGMLPLINSTTGKIHTTFNQAVTATGRLSSTAPNLQNIPIRLEEGRRLRRIFVPSQEDWVLVAADYSQIELRVLAHIAQDEKFIEAFREEQDIHRRTASEVFGIPFDEVTSEHRDRAKAVNFGIVYGISDYGLATNLGISRKEAKEYIESFFARYPGVRSFQETIVQQARVDGYVTTLLNRRRYLPDILSKNFNMRSFAERTAINTPIQGSAADIIKLAMVRLNNIIQERSIVGRMLLQVHDELICECPAEEQPAVEQALIDAMEKAVKLSVPLKIDIKVGKDWYSVQKVKR